MNTTNTGGRAEDAGGMLISDPPNRLQLTLEGDEWLAGRCPAGEQESIAGFEQCEAEMVVRVADLAQFAKFAVAEPGKKWIHAIKDYPALARIRSDEAYHGWANMQLDAADAGLPFYGRHDEVDDYEASVFAAKDGELAMAATSLRLDDDLQPHYGEEVLELAAKMRAVKTLFGMLETRPRSTATRAYLTALDEYAPDSM